MRKSVPAFLVIAAALCLAGCASSGESTVSGSASAAASESGEADIAQDISEPQSITADSVGSSDVSVGDTDSEPDILPDTAVGASEQSDPTEESISREVSSEDIGINNDIVSELGMTYGQLTEKHGSPQGSFNLYTFENGYGRYGWKSYDGSIFDDMDSAGGCNMIDGLKPEELFLGAELPARLDEFAAQYGLEAVSVDEEIGMDSRYWAEYTHPLYDNISFIVTTAEYGMINTDAGCCITMNVDCLQAQPISVD